MGEEEKTRNRRVLLPGIMPVGEIQSEVTGLFYETKGIYKSKDPARQKQ